MVRPPPETVPPAPVVIHQPAPAEKGVDMLSTVNVMDVYSQGAERCRVKIMSQADNQKRLDTHFQIEGRPCPVDPRPTIGQRSAFPASEAGEYVDLDADSIEWPFV